MNHKAVQNSIKNSVFAVLLRLLQIVFPFVTRTIVIHTLGLAYVGVSGLFSSIFGVLEIAELGIGSALLQALYEPIKQNDREKENAIINFYRKAYFIIGIVITVISLLLVPFLKNIIKAGTYPEDLNIYYIYFVNIASTAIGYLIYSYKSLLLEAHQRGRDANKVRILFSFLQYGVQIPVLLITGNYYLYVSIGPIISLLSVLAISGICDKRLPGYEPKGDLSTEDKTLLQKNISALFLYKIGSVVNNNVDGVVISAFLGATILGAYNNYYLIVSSVSALIAVCYTAILPSVGHSLVNKNNEEKYELLMDYMVVDEWLNGWCAICLSCLLTPFIHIWAGSESSFNELFAILFGIYFFFWRLLDPVSMFKDTLGIWNRDKWRPLATAIVNLVTNIILVNIIGIYGILLSTIISVVVVSFPFSVRVLMQELNKSSKEYFTSTIKTIFFILIIGAITWCLCNAVSVNNSILSLFLKLLVCLVVPNSAFMFFYKDNPVLKSAGEMVRRRMK